MRIIFAHTVFLGTLLVAFANVASATIAFRFAGNEQNVENVPFLPESGSGPLTVTTTGHLPGQNDPANAALSYVTPLGLAVNNTTVTPDDRNLVPISVFQAVNTFQLDSGHGGEFARLEFSQPVQIELVYFTDAGAGERFSLFADGQAIDIPALLGTDEIIKIHPAGMVEFPDTMPIATTYDFFAHSSVAIHNVHVEGVIPEPTAALVWCGFGLTLLAWYRRRAKFTSKLQTEEPATEVAGYSVCA